MKPEDREDLAVDALIAFTLKGRDISKEELVKLMDRESYSEEVSLEPEDEKALADYGDDVFRMKPFEVIRKNIGEGVYPSLGTRDVTDEALKQFRYDVEKECLSFGLNLSISQEISQKAKDFAIIYFHDLEDVVNRVASRYHFANFVIKSTNQKDNLDRG